MSAKTDSTGFCPRVTSRSRETATWMRPATADPTKSAGSIVAVSFANMSTLRLVRVACTSSWACAQLAWNRGVSRLIGLGCRL
jgi:hypothetical protein